MNLVIFGGNVILNRSDICIDILRIVVIAIKEVVPHTQHIGLVVDVKGVVGFGANLNHTFFLLRGGKSLGQRRSERNVVDFVEVDALSITAHRQRVAVVREHKILGHSKVIFGNLIALFHIESLRKGGSRCGAQRGSGHTCHKLFHQNATLIT